MIWLIYIIVGAVLGVAVGALMNIRAIFLVGSWIPTYAVLGALWGIYAASNYTSDKNRYKDKGYSVPHHAGKLCGGTDGRDHFSY